MGIFNAIQGAFYRHFYDNEEDALKRARQRLGALEIAQSRIFEKTSNSTQASLFESEQSEINQ